MKVTFFSYYVTVLQAEWVEKLPMWLNPNWLHESDFGQIAAPGFFDRLLNNVVSPLYNINHSLLNDTINHKKATINNTGVSICPESGR